MNPHRSPAKTGYLYIITIITEILFFCKGPLLIAGSDIIKNMSPATIANIASCKNYLRQSLLSIQSSGDTCEWQNRNFHLHNIPGLRRSRVKYRSIVDYTD